MRLYILQEIKNQVVKNTSNIFSICQKYFRYVLEKLFIWFQEILNFSAKEEFLSFTIEKHLEVSRFIYPCLNVNQHLHVYLIAYTWLNIYWNCLLWFIFIYAAFSWHSRSLFFTKDFSPDLVWNYTHK